MAWRNGVMAAIGLWFVVSAWALNPMHSQAYLWTAVILGGLVFLGSLWALWDKSSRRWREYLEALFGLYLGLTPFLYRFTGHPWALWVTMVVGLLTIIGGLWQAIGPFHGSHDKSTHRAA